MRSRSQMCDCLRMRADEARLPSGTVTFLFTDVEGSTRLWAADKDAMSASLLVHDAILRAAIEGNGGYVFTTTGDSFAAAFGRASDAVRAATESQRALTDAAWPGPILSVRMGLHLGEAEERGGDYFGPVVNSAARVEAAAHGGQVLLTEPVRIAASATDVTDLGIRSLRDVPEPLRLFQLGTGTFAALRVIDPSMSNLPVRPTRLIGRDAELGRIRGLLAESRLVTVTAVGGSGKTRLAIAVGEAELAHHRSGVRFVDLSAVSNGAEVPGAIANGLGLNLVSEIRRPRSSRFWPTSRRSSSSTTASTSSTKPPRSSKRSSLPTTPSRSWRRAVRRSTSTVNGPSSWDRYRPTRPTRRVSVSSSTGLRRSIPSSHSPTRTRRRSVRFAAVSMGCRSPSSWPQRGSRL